MPSSRTGALLTRAISRSDCCRRTYCLDLICGASAQKHITAADIFTLTGSHVHAGSEMICCRTTSIRTCGVAASICRRALCHETSSPAPSGTMLAASSCLGTAAAAVQVMTSCSSSSAAATLCSFRAGIAAAVWGAYGATYAPAVSSRVSELRHQE